MTPPSAQPLIRVVYQSTSLISRMEGAFRAELASILESCARRNPALGVTGALIYERGRWVQLLEGPPASVDALLDAIEVDIRHGMFQILWRTPAETRLFEQWSMAFMDAGAAPLPADAPSPWERAGPMELAARLAFAADHLSVLSVPVSDTPADVRQRFHQPSAYA
jgi:hypothetical protein